VVGTRGRVANCGLPAGGTADQTSKSGSNPDPPHSRMIPPHPVNPTSRGRRRVAAITGISDFRPLQGQNMIEIDTHSKLPKQFAYRTFVVRDDREAALLAGDMHAYYWRSRKMLFIPIGKVEPVIHDSEEV